MRKLINVTFPHHNAVINHSGAPFRRAALGDKLFLPLLFLGDPAPQLNRVEIFETGNRRENATRTVALIHHM